MYFTKNIVIKNRLFIQIEVFRTLKELEYGTVYMGDTPIMGIPVAYTDQMLLNNLSIQGRVVRLYPYKAGRDLFEECTTFILQKTKEPMLKIAFEDKKIKLTQVRHCIGTSYQWFDKNNICEESVEAQVQVIPGLDVKPMY